MIISKKEAVARVKNQFKLLTKDDEVNDRFILSVLESTAKTYLAQRLDDRSLFRDSSIYSEIDCIEMIDNTIFSCDIVDFKSCDKLVRSKEKIPGLIFGRYGSSIKEVYSIDRQTELKQSTLSTYRRNKKRQGSDDTLYFYVLNDYIYIPDSEVKRVSVYAIVTDLYDVEQISNCSTCCESAWDKPFITTSKLLDSILDKALQSIQIIKNIQEDSKGDLNNTTK